MQFTDKLEKQPKQTSILTVTLAWSELEKGKEQALEKLQKETEVEGFRKGKAPAKIVREKLGESKLLEQATGVVLSEVYRELLKKHNLRPFIDPKVTLLKAPVGGEWEIRFELAESPVLTKTPDYKKIAEEVKSEAKKGDIWVPGKDKDQKEEVNEEKKKNEKMQMIFNKLVEQAEIDISPLIVEEEVSRRLVTLYEEIKKLGLSVEQYLKTKNETQDGLRAKIINEVTDIYKSEFILDVIAQEAKIVVEDKELETVFKTAKDDKEKEMLRQNAYFYSRLMRKQKTLEFLASL